MFSKNKLIFFLIFILFFISPKNIFAQVVINEVSSASEPEWVEIYNTSVEEVSLQNYLINFGSETQNKIFCDQDKVAPNGYKLIVLTTNWLSNTGDLVTLKKGDDIADSIGYGTGYTLGKPSSTGSITRSPDGGPEWVVITLSTQQGEQASFVCPTPTPTQSPTDQPTSQPTQAPTTSPTKSPTPVPTKSPTIKPTASPTPTKEPEQKVESLKGLSISVNSTETPIGMVAGAKTSKKSPVIAIIFIVFGIGFLGYGGYLLYNNIHNGSTKNQ